MRILIVFVSNNFLCKKKLFSLFFSLGGYLFVLPFRLFGAFLRNLRFVLVWLPLYQTYLTLHWVYSVVKAEILVFFGVNRRRARVFHLVLNGFCGISILKTLYAFLNLLIQNLWFARGFVWFRVSKSILALQGPSSVFSVKGVLFFSNRRYAPLGGGVELVWLLRFYRIDAGYKSASTLRGLFEC